MTVILIPASMVAPVLMELIHLCAAVWMGSVEKSVKLMMMTVILTLVSMEELALME